LSHYLIEKEVEFVERAHEREGWVLVVGRTDRGEALLDAASARPPASPSSLSSPSPSPSSSSSK
jgi:hypothetical protein